MILRHRLRGHTELPAISCCLIAGWCSAISTRIWSRVTSLLLRRIEYRGSSLASVKQHQSLAFHIEMRDTLGEALDKGGADTELACNIVNGSVAAGKPSSTFSTTTRNCSSLETAM